MKKFSASLMASLTVAVVSCTPATNPHYKVGNPYTIEGKQYVPSITPKYAEIGMASWYGNGDGFHNELTANGELFDKDDLTAAHKTLPLPSIVTVTNLENGKTIKLRVNDRGPFVKGRIIDVSERAAEKLGFRSKGSAKVLVELDKEGSLKALENVTVSDENYKKLKNAYGDAVPSVRLAFKNKDMNVINSALNTENKMNIARSKSVNFNKTIAAPVVPVSSNTDKIVIRDKIIKPKTVTYNTYNVLESKNTPKSMVGLTPKRIAAAPAKNVSYIDSDKGLFVQVASLTDRSKAAEISRKISRFAENKIVEAVVNGKLYYRVRLGAFASKSDAQIEMNKVKGNGFADAYIVSEN